MHLRLSLRFLSKLIKALMTLLKAIPTIASRNRFPDYIVGTVRGVYNNLDAIDEKIKGSIKFRRFERLDNVCLAAMRLAVYEMLYSDEVPVPVAINEAIELTKQYDDSLAGFVHGNLWIIARG